MSKYVENTHYVGTVTSHDFVTGYNNSPQIVLTVDLRAKAKKQGDLELESGVDQIDESLRLPVRLYFDLSPTNPKLEKVISELKTLGFSHTDPKLFGRLHPQHPKHHSFVNKDVLVRVWINPQGKERWFLVTNKQETFDYDAFLQILEDNLGAYETASGNVG